MPMVLCCWLNKKNEYITKYVKYPPPEYRIGYINQYEHELIAMYVVSSNIFYPISDSSQQCINYEIYKRNCESLEN